MFKLVKALVMSVAMFMCWLDQELREALYFYVEETVLDWSMAKMAVLCYCLVVTARAEVLVVL